MNGIHSMSWEQYAKADGVSKSALDWIAPPYTPAHFKARFIDGTLLDEETPAKRLGTLTHRCILEPESISGAFHIKPEDMSFATKEGKAWKADHSDRPIIAHDEAGAINAMADAVWSHPMAKRLLTGGEFERSLFATDADGILRKGRLDALTAGNIIPDLKTVTSTDLEWVEKQIDACGWYRQAAYYLDLCKLLGMDKAAFVLVCVEKTAPFDVCCYEVAAEVIEIGRRTYQRDLALLNHCRAENEWPGRSRKIESAGLPGWKMKQLESL